MLFFDLLFTNSFRANLIFTNDGEYVYYAMKELGYDKYYILFVTILAVFSAHLINYAIGRLFRKIEKHHLASHRAESLKAGDVMFRRKYFPILLFMCIPMWGMFVSIVAGVFRYNFLYYCMLSTLAIAISYFYLIFI